MRIPFVDKFPVNALLILKRGKGISAQYDKARYITKGEACYEFKKYKVKTLPCSYDNLIIMKGGKPLGIFYEYERDMIIPLDLNEIDKKEIEVSRKKLVDKDGEPICDKDGNQREVIEKKTVGELLRIVDPGVAFWGQQRRRKAEERHKNPSWWANNMSFVAMALVFVLMIILSYIFMTSISDSSMNVANALNNLANKPPG